jgi:hypothetical protein
MRFYDVYARRSWAHRGVLSGEGSTVSNSRPVLEWLEKQAEEGMRTILDLGCGDLEWISRCEPVTSGLMRYEGWDVVGPLIDHHLRVFPWFTGRAVDMEDMPKIDADVVILKDVLFHHCNGKAEQILKNVFGGTWRRLLVTSHPGADNSNRKGLQGGGFKPFDVEATGLLAQQPAEILPRAGGGAFLIFARDSF